MSVENPAFIIPRQEVRDHVAHWVKTLEAPKASPKTPERLLPTNPVPEFMQSLGLLDVNTPNTLEPDLMHGRDLVMWDGQKVKFFLFRLKGLPSPFNNGSYPGPTIRIPRGVIFHAKAHGHGQPPHTIHWHGIEPTPMNDGVGHTSFELGRYTYQWQPNYIGSYFYHCHVNTVQHYKFGLFGPLIIEPPDAFETGPGKNPGGYPRRTAANVSAFPQFPGYIGGTLESGDPHAQTVPYDVEASWVIDDIDSVWMDSMDNARDTRPKPGSKPGVNDRFGRGDFHDYNPDYFFVTGVAFPGRRGQTITLPSGNVIPPALNSGVTGMQVDINARVNQTILLRTIATGYSHLRVKFPIDVVIIALDGRALGIPPFDGYNRAFLLPAGTFFDIDTAERKDFLIRSEVPVNSYAEVMYLNHRNDNELIFTGRIPIRIT